MSRWIISKSSSDKILNLATQPLPPMVDMSMVNTDMVDTDMVDTEVKTRQDKIYFGHT